MTSAQIELGVIDAPLTSYDDKKGDKKITKKQADAMYERWKKRRGGRRFAGKEVTADELFGGNRGNQGV